MLIQVPEEVFKIGIMDKQYHDRLILNLSQYAEVAGIPPEFVWSKMSQYCTEKDVEWVRRMKEGKDHGLVYTGKNFKVPVESKMMAIAGACLRNYIDARMMTVQAIASYLEEGTMPTPTVVLVPNFCMAKEDKNSIAPWQAAALLGWLYSRLAKNLKTVLYVGDQNTLETVYGEAMLKHLKAHYTFI